MIINKRQISIYHNPNENPLSKHEYFFNFFNHKSNPMKVKMLLAGRILAAIVLIVAFNACKSSKKALKPSDMGETLIEQYCTGSEYQSSKDFFRANGVSESMDQNVAKQKALVNARTLLAQQIETTIKNVTDNYIKAVEGNNVEELEERFEMLTREVTNQKLNGTKVICDKLTKTNDGNYKSYIAVELGGDEIASAMRQRLSSDQMLKIDFDYEKYRKVFDEEMKKFSEGR